MIVSFNLFPSCSRQIFSRIFRTIKVYLLLMFSHAYKAGGKDTIKNWIEVYQQKL